MKKILTLFLLISTFQHSLLAQNIVDIFYRIPAKYVDDLNLTERQNLIKNTVMEKHDLKYSANFDVKSGYLRMEFTYTEGQSGFGVYELTYWNLSDGKLIALSVKNGSNAGFHQSDLKFFTLKSNKISLTQKPVFTGYSTDFETTMSNILASFAISGLSSEQKQQMIHDGLTIELPKKGTDIVIGITEEAVERHADKLKKTKQTYYFDRKSGTFHLD